MAMGSSLGICTEYDTKRTATREGRRFAYVRENIDNRAGLGKTKANVSHSSPVGILGGLPSVRSRCEPMSQQEIARGTVKNRAHKEDAVYMECNQAGLTVLGLA